jgi:hypothetical protein
MCGRARLSSDVSEIKLVFSIPPQMTIDHAYKDWGIKLPTTGHQFPLMGPTGCTALPHLRPWCTLHQCQIQATGSTKDRNWDAKYFRLRNQLTRLEQQLAEM